MSVVSWSCSCGPLVSRAIASHRTPSLEICRHPDFSRALCHVSAATRRQDAGSCGLCGLSAGFAPASAPFSPAALWSAPPEGLPVSGGVSHNCCPMHVRDVLWDSMDPEVPGLSADLCPVCPAAPAAPDGPAVCRGSVGCVVFITAGRWTMCP
ncbi:uncharacterized protein LOC116562697 [Sapajus apella]|uniref:Uncharacterized protein LOC116562697 n=1 Tax=Sapajus apella TaxID=9515 RepID=A0A6J3J8M2_SAPAP|nr:uncharacterized protein LOC116562697 [Sapajus apella]